MAGIGVILDAFDRSVSRHKELFDQDPSYSFIDDDNTQYLCSCIESLFLHCQDDGAYLKITRFMRMSNKPQPKDSNFWIYIKHYLPKTLIEIIEKSSHQRTQIGCCRVWVRLALNEATLFSYLESSQHDQKRVQQFYTPNSILRDKSAVARVIDHLREVSNCTFNLNLTCPLLNSWAHCITLQLAGIFCNTEHDSFNTASLVIGSGEDVTIETNSNDAAAVTTPTAEAMITELSGPPKLHPSVQETPVIIAENLIEDDNPGDCANSPVIDTRHPSSDSNDEITRTANQELMRRHAESLLCTTSDSPDSSDVEARLLQNTEDLLQKEVAKLRTSSAGLHSDSSSTSDQQPSSILPGSNSLSSSAQGWWAPVQQSICDPPTGTGDTEQGEVFFPSTEMEESPRPKTYSELWSQAVPSLNHVYSSVDPSSPPNSTDVTDDAEHRHNNGPLSTDNTAVQGGHQENNFDATTSAGDSNGVPIPTVDNEDAHSMASRDSKSITDPDEWLFLGDEIFVSDTETQRLLDLYPGADHIASMDGQNTVVGGRCRKCEARLKQESFVIDHYDGRLYCKNCHSDETCIIPRDVINNWDFTPKSVSQDTKRFLAGLISNPNIHIGQLNSSLYTVVPALHQLRRLRHQLSVMWYQITSCDVRASAKLRRQLFPREYMLGTLQEIDLYSLEDLIIARSGTLERVLQNAIDRIALPHVRNCRNCQAAAVACDTCRLDSKLIQLHEIDTYKRCSTFNCPRLLHTQCLPPKSRSVHCRLCRSHLEQHCKPNLSNYDANFVE